jgi:hypothetical protein
VLRAWSCWAAACAVVVCSASGAHAQTFKDKLKSDVREGIDEAHEKKKRAEERERAEQAKPKPEPRSEPKPKPDKSKLEDDPNAIKFSLGDVVDEIEPERKGPALPLRVFGKNLKIDIKLGAGYRGWYPQQYEAVDVDVGNYFTWNVNVKAKIFKWLNLRRGYYESNGLAAPRTEEAAVTAKIGSYAPKAVWLLGVIGIPITKAWEPVIRYETRAFATEAHPLENVCVVDRDAPEDATDDCPGTMGDLKIVSGFETLVLGVRYDHSRTNEAVVTENVRGKIPPITIGVGYMHYRKPYQLTFDGVTLREYLFDARFRGLGLAGGVELGGGFYRFFGDVDIQLGLAEVSLTNSTTLNELVPSDHMIGYVQGNAVLGYTWPLWEGPPTFILQPQIEFGGASFFLFDTKVTEDEEGSTLPVNWDLLWTAQVSLLVPF